MTKVRPQWTHAGLLGGLRAANGKRSYWTLCMKMTKFPYKPHKFDTVKVNKLNSFTESIGYFHPPPLILLPLECFFVTTPLLCLPFFSEFLESLVPLTESKLGHRKIRGQCGGKISSVHIRLYTERCNYLVAWRPEHSYTSSLGVLCRGYDKI